MESAERRSGWVRELVPFGLLLAGAAALRTIAWLRTAALFDDGPTFVYLAEGMLAGEWSAVLRHPYHPLYPFAVLLAGFATGDLEQAAALVSIASGTAAVALLVLLLRDLFDRRVAFVGGVLLAVHPFAVSVSSDVQSDGFYAALFLGAAFLLLRALRSQSPALAGWAGVVSGLAYLTRPEGLGVALVAVVAATWLVLRGRFGLRSAAGWLAVLAVGVLLPVTPYLVALRVETGGWAVTQKKSIGQLAGVPGASPATLASAGGPGESAIPAVTSLRRATDPPRAQPAEGVGRVAVALNEIQAATVGSFRLELLVFLAVGLWTCRGRPGERGLFIGAFPLLYGLVLFGLALSAGYVSRRHALPPLLPALGYAAVGVPVVGRALARGALRLTPGRGGRAAGGPPAWIATALGLALVSAFALPRDLRARRPERLAERLAAEWLRGNMGEPGAVATARPRVAYYARAPYVPLPSGRDEDMLVYLRAHGARYVIVDVAKVDDHLGLRAGQERGLRLLHEASARGRSAAVFAVEAAPGS